MLSKGVVHPFDASLKSFSCRSSLRSEESKRRFPAGESTDWRLNSRSKIGNHQALFYTFENHTRSQVPRPTDLHHFVNDQRCKSMRCSNSWVQKVLTESIFKTDPRSHSLSFPSSPTLSHEPFQFALLVLFAHASTRIGSFSVTSRMSRPRATRRCPTVLWLQHGRCSPRVNIQKMLWH